MAAAAAIELSILAGAGRETVATVVQRDSPKLGPGDLPVVLGDGWGAVIAACGKRVLSPADYFATRRGCESGDVWLVRVFVTKAKDVDVRVGSLELGNDVVFARRFPSLRVQGEVELADEAEAKALEADLAPVIALANGGSQGPAAAMALGKVIAAHGAALSRSAKVRAVLAAKDAELVPALRAVGTAKAAAAEKLRPVELAGLAQRGARRAFADLNEVGEVAVGTLSAAWDVDTPALLPRATAAYESALEPALKLAARKKPSAADAQAARKAGLASAAACGAAVKRVKAAEQRLLACAFAQEPCDPGKTAASMKESDDAALALVQARRDLDRAMTGPGEPFRAELAKAGSAAGCVELWW